MLWKGARVSKYKILHECLKWGCVELCYTAAHLYCCSSILNSNMLPLGKWMPTNPSFPSLPTNLSNPANFDLPLVLNIGRWLIRYIMLKGYSLRGLFQTWSSSFPAPQTQRRQWGNRGPEEGIPQAGFATKENSRSTASDHGLCAEGLSIKDCKASKWLSWLVPKRLKVKEIKFLWCL